jgi:hypothetical protein
MPGMCTFQAICLLLLLETSSGTILNVPEEFNSIQGAIDTSTTGDTVLVAPGTYFEHLTGPEHSLTLASRHLLSGDTLDIQTTILDGTLDGTILQARASGENRTIVDGFVFQRGRGLGTFEGAEGGGIHLNENANLTLRNSVFRENVCDGSGSCIRSYNFDDEWHHEITIDNVSFHDNNPYSVGDGEIDVMILSHEVVRVSSMNIHSTTGENSGAFSIRSNDSLIVNGVRMENLINASLSLTSEDYLEVNSLFANHSLLREVNLMGGNCYFSNHNFDSLEFRNADGIWCSADYSLTAEGVFVTNCVSHLPGVSTTAHLFSVLVSGTEDNERFGELRNLQVINNLVGNTTPSEHSATASVVRIWNVNLYESSLSGNEMHLTPDNQPNPSFVNIRGPLLWTNYTLPVDTARIQDCVFENNLLVDHDDYSEVTYTPNPSKGRSLYVTSNATDLQHIELRSLSFRNNRQPNHCPEYGGNQWWGVSGDVYLDLSTNLESISVHNVLMEDIDDGGMIVFPFGSPRVEIDNIAMRRVNRMGFWLNGSYEEDVSVSNLMFDSIIEQDLYNPYPFTYSAQRVVWTGRTPIRNVTVSNCNLSMLFSVAGGLENSIIVGNEFQLLNNPIIDDPLPFQYCLSNVELNGEGNILSGDPMFSTETGMPFLASDSPCIDSGNPDPVYNDPEDPANPGGAMWPAQGGLRNDIGFTGGPGMYNLAVDWLPVFPQNHWALPWNFDLGEPYPNPFNPVTWIPYKLQVPTNVRVRVYSLIGRLLTDHGIGTLPSGQHVYPVDGSQWATGVYLVEVLAGEERDVKKVMLLR